MRPAIAMYHDQGHIPMKTSGFTLDIATGKWTAVSGVNMTLGLPVIRVSVDHGTAFGKAGKEPRILRASYKPSSWRPGSLQARWSCRGEAQGVERATTAPVARSSEHDLQEQHVDGRPGADA